MTHRAEASMQRFERGKFLVMRGLDDVLRGSDHDNLAIIYFLKETGGAGKLAMIAGNFGNSGDTRGLAREALRLISADERFDADRRTLANETLRELDLLSPANFRRFSPLAEGRAAE